MLIQFFSVTHTVLRYSIKLIFQKDLHVQSLTKKGGTLPLNAIFFSFPLIPTLSQCFLSQLS